MLYIVTATITFQCSILIQQLIRLYAPYCYSDHYVSMLYITATLTSYALFWYSNYYGPILYIVKITITSL
jgi:hypothetical protein